MTIPLALGCSRYSKYGPPFVCRRDNGSIVVRVTRLVAWLLRRIAVCDMPALFEFRGLEFEDQLGNLPSIQGSTPKARQIPSSFSITSGWISAGSITAAIS